MVLFQMQAGGNEDPKIFTWANLAPPLNGGRNPATYKQAEMKRH